MGVGSCDAAKLEASYMGEAREARVQSVYESLADADSSEFFTRVAVDGALGQLPEDFDLDQAHSKFLESTSESRFKIADGSVREGNKRKVLLTGLSVGLFGLGVPFVGWAMVKSKEQSK